MRAMAREHAPCTKVLASVKPSSISSTASRLTPARRRRTHEHSRRSDRDELGTRNQGRDQPGFGMVYTRGADTETGGCAHHLRNNVKGNWSMDYRKLGRTGLK